MSARDGVLDARTAQLLLVTGSDGKEMPAHRIRAATRLRASGLSVVEVGVDLRRPRAYSLDGIRDAAASLEDGRRSGSLLLGGVGGAAILAGIVTAERDAGGLLSVDGSLVSSAARLRSWGGPVLFLQSPGAGPAVRAAAVTGRRALGRQARWPVAELGTPAADKAVGEWRRMAFGWDWPTRRVSGVRRLAVPTAVALGLGSGAAMLGGSPVAAAQRSGDGVRAVVARAAAGNGPARHVLKGAKLRRRQRRGDGAPPRASGAVKLIDKAGMEWFVNTDITFQTSSSASGANSEASFTHSVTASTLSGGTTHERLNDAYDGYNSIFVSVNGTVCNDLGVAGCTSYGQAGKASLSCDNRVVDTPVKAIGGINVSREIYVPTDDHFERALNIFQNPGSSAVTVTMTTSNNLGSDSNTVITGTSAGGTTISDADQWVTTFQNWSGTTTTDPRLGHVMYADGASVHATHVTFVNGSDNPTWSYTFTVPSEGTVVIGGFAVADATIAQSKADSARLLALPPTALECMTPAQQSELANFGTAPAVTSQPANQTVKVGQTATFTAAASAVGLGQTPTVQWQVSTDGGSTFGNIAGATSDTLTVTDAPGTANGNQYRAAFTNGFGTVDSAPATLTVQAVGYRLVTGAGGVVAFGTGNEGSLVSSGVTPAAPVDGIAATPDDAGYWIVDQSGGVYAFGDAKFRGSMGAQQLHAKVVGIAPTPDGRGYWLVASDGGVFAFGDARFHGSLGGSSLNEPIVGIAPTPGGRGYWLVASDGGVFAFGDAKFRGSLGAEQLGTPIVGIAPAPDGRGYLLAGANGGVFAFGSGRYRGSMGGQPLNKPIVGISATGDGLGYELAGGDGGVFTFGDARFLGSAANLGLTSPVTGITG